LHYVIILHFGFCPTEYLLYAAINMHIKYLYLVFGHNMAL
jgi:hypothetical protein